MSSRMSKADKEKEKIVQEKVQRLLTAMLKDEDNKYCADCDSKGPRWASWNLGVFLCIRCAGIHRNLGVHISKVKSVNLDSWTPQQVASMQQMGNSRGRAVYEAATPDDFRRPQSDQAVESFIRQKYEKKKFISSDYTPTKPPDFPTGWNDEATADNKKSVEFKKLQLPTKSSAAVSPPVGSPRQESKAATKPSPAPVPASLTVSLPPVSAVDTDLLGLSLGSDPIPASNSAPVATSAAQDLLGLGDFSDFVSAAPVSLPADFTPGGASVTAPAPVDPGKMSNDSILALFGPKPTPAPASAAFGQPAPAFSIGSQQNSGLMGLYSNQTQMNPVGQFQQQANNPFLDLSKVGGGVASPSLWQ